MTSKRYAKIDDYLVLFGGDSQGSDDCTLAVQSAIDDVIAQGGGHIEFSAGVYRFNEGSSTIQIGEVSLSFSGAGKNQTTLKFEEGSSTDSNVGLRKHLFTSYNQVSKGSLSFSDLTIEGTFKEKEWVESGGSPFFLWGYSEISLINCRLTNLSFMASICEMIGNVLVTGCTVDYTARDGIRFRQSPNVKIINNYFKANGDDSVALHCISAFSGTKTREGIIIANNVFEATRGIRVLSGRMTSISCNIFKRSIENPISVYSGGGVFGSESDTNVFGVDIVNNQIYDTVPLFPFTTQPSLGIAVFGVGEGGSNTVGVIPGQPTSDGTFLLPWNYRNNSLSSTTAGVASPFKVKIQGNTIARTLPAGSPYSYWGYGEVYDHAGPHDPVVTDTALRLQVGIQVGAEVGDVIISDNNISHVNVGILPANGVSKFSLNNWIVSNNIITDFSFIGIGTGSNSSVNSTCNATFSGNLINGDPYHLSNNRGYGGAWKQPDAPFAFDFSMYRGLKIENNKISNVAIVANGGTGMRDHYWQNNIIRCEPFTDGWSTNNKSVGGVPHCAAGFVYEIYYSDPSQPNYNTQKSQTLQLSPSIPTSGTYVAGCVVRANNVANVFGWVRMTTGINHVLGVDWKVISQN